MTLTATAHTEPPKENGTPSVSTDFEVKSRGRVFLGRETLDRLNIDGKIGSGTLEGTSVQIQTEEVQRYAGLSIAGRFMECILDLQRDGEVTIPHNIREYFDVDVGDTLWLTVKKYNT